MQRPKKISMNDEEAKRPWMNSSKKIIALELHERQQNSLVQKSNVQQEWKNVNKKKYLSKVQTTHSAAKND